MTVTGAILTGGLSSRMGRPKHELVLSDGRTMLEHVAETLWMLCDDLVLLCGAEPLPQPSASRKGDRGAAGLRRISDLRPGLGPLGGIEALLASGLGSQYLVAPCDVPLLSAEMLRLLVDADTARLASVFRTTKSAASGMEFDPLPARIDAQALPIVQQSLDRGQSAVWRLMKQLDPAIVDVPSELSWRLRNVNTPAEYRAIFEDAAASTAGGARLPSGGAGG